MASVGDFTHRQSIARLQSLTTALRPTLADVPKTLRFAVVKSQYQPNLYTTSGETVAATLLASSIKHTGPLGLFTRFKSQFLIIDTDGVPDASLWMQKVGRPGQEPIEYYMRVAQERHSALGGLSQKDVAVRAESINWSDYDIVIALDACVPASISLSYPDVLWCYMPSEPNMPLWAASHRKCLNGYDTFLTQRPWSAPGERHICDFPWVIQYYGLYDDILGEKLSSEPIVYLEPNLAHSLPNLPIINGCEITGPSGSMADVARELHKSRYFACFGRYGRRLWGNATVEAICAGALPLGSPGLHKNRAFFPRELTCRSFPQLSRMVADLELNTGRYDAMAQVVREITDISHFYGPVGELWTRLADKRIGAAVLATGQG
ncbi:MAG: hypothetical protein Q7T44_00075 [Parvibaculum sp.]|nr:hypothetical protein [Parvibaculum sp.]